MLANLLFGVLSALVVTVYGQTQHAGELFYFNPGLGACGLRNTSSQYVASLSQQNFNSYPGATINPNDNPICHAVVTIQGPAPGGGIRTVRAQVVDLFTDPNRSPDDIGVSPVVFQQFAPLGTGTLSNINWAVPGL